MNIVVLENTRSCNLRCRACPTVYAKNYPAGFMTWETFEQILEHISPSIFPNCALTGWGEPMLDKKFFDRLIRLKKKGFAVGTTSNTLLLSQETLQRLATVGLDQLNISWDFYHLEAAGLDPQKMAQHLRTLLAPYQDQGLPFRLICNVVLSRKWLSYFPKWLEYLRPFPFVQIGVIPLIMIPSLDLFPELITKAELLSLKQQVQENFPELEVKFLYLDDPPPGNCRSDIFQNVYVTYEGLVAPCCILALEFPNLTFQGQLYQIKPLFFGDLRQSYFEEIWESPSYQVFRESFARGQIPPACQGCNVWRRLPD